MSERLVSGKGPEIQGEGNLKTIKVLNGAGRFAVIAPNHLKPQGMIARKLGAPDDFAMLKNVLDSHGVSSKAVVKGDTNIAFSGNGTTSRMMQTLYEWHRTIFSQLMAMKTGGIPISINDKQPEQNVAANIGAIREMIKTLEETDNLLIYPYGNWAESGEQQFDPNIDLDDGRSFVDKQKEFERWRVSLKNTFIRLAQRTGSPIAPVYVAHDKEWIVHFGELINVPANADSVEIAKKYLESMRKLKDN